MKLSEIVNIVFPHKWRTDAEAMGVLNGWHFTTPSPNQPGCNVYQVCQKTGDRRAFRRSTTPIDHHWLGSGSGRYQIDGVAYTKQKPTTGGGCTMI